MTIDQWGLVLSLLLTAALAGDAILSLRPPRFIRDCLEGVRFPADWWWVLIVVKLAGAAGLLTGLSVPGVGLAAAAGAVVYFLCAAAAHLRARFLGTAFWFNCLGMLALSLATTVVLVFAG
ncbi:DoxX family protein [Brevibacterium album]|uniref:DoxX family protein n=1 Tax=Brevibacterium album TaxID=417948 RepID=UPI000405FB7C|nr:DoxX family protein [Brevibacterium album]